jgi:hypothetical protein
LPWDGDAERQEGVDEEGGVPVGLILGILGGLLLLGLLGLLVFCLVRRKKCCCVPIAAPPTKVVTVSDGYMEPVGKKAHAYSNGAYSNDYADPPPAYDNAVYEVIAVVPPKVAPKPSKATIEKTLEASGDEVEGKVDVKEMKKRFE